MRYDIDENSARAYSVYDARTHQPNSVTRRGLLHHEQVQLKKRALNVIRISQLSIGSMTGRERDLAKLMRIKRVDVLWVQETRWKGNKAKELRGGGGAVSYKVICSGANEQGRNGVGVVLSGEMKNAVIEVRRKNDRVKRVKICYGGETMNIISAYAPQEACTEEEKSCVWNEMNEVTQELEEQEMIVVGADFNGHVGNENYVIELVREGHGIEERNPEGEGIVHFAMFLI
ncbi:craniofacial development protein 2-like [Macrobrachium nipponense]|uniref:craniofacial development protein 2-like n=1 Tax=Macrobrachium nipponense TaxID=159736 RepID=UPI0030C7C4A4